MPYRLICFIYIKFNFWFVVNMFYWRRNCVKVEINIFVSALTSRRSTGDERRVCVELFVGVYVFYEGRGGCHRHERPRWRGRVVGYVMKVGESTRHHHGPLIYMHRDGHLSYRATSLKVIERNTHILILNKIIQHQWLALWMIISRSGITKADLVLRDEDGVMGNGCEPGISEKWDLGGSKGGTDRYGHEKVRLVRRHEIENIIEMKMEGKCHKGRPRLRWKDTVWRDLKACNIREEWVTDREQLKGLYKTCCPAQREDGERWEWTIIYEFRKEFSFPNFFIWCMCKISESINSTQLGQYSTAAVFWYRT